MRLHSLTMTAFGPFAGTERVDLDALSTAGLFLFTGATGAGKTSVLDAVCFALYGQVPGARQQARSVRSDHAAEDARPEVVLEVTLRGRRLRITRSPQWDRPKRRGGGTTNEPAKVRVEETGPHGWAALATRLDESGQLLGRLLGLSLAQFCQVVLLPQGQFAEFLRADADRRGELLENLFDTARFTAVEGWLVARRQVAARELDDVDLRLAQLVARVAEVAGADVPEPLDASGSRDWVDRLLDVARADDRSAASDRRAAEAGAASALQALDVGRRLADLQQRRSVLADRLADLRAAQVDHDRIVLELSAARTVAPLVPLLDEVRRLQSQLEELRSGAVEAQAALVHPLLHSLPATGTDGTTGLPPVEAVRAESRRVRHEIGDIRRLEAQEAEAEALGAAVDALERRVVEIEAQTAKAASWLQGADARRSALEADRDVAYSAATQRDELRAGYQRAADQWAAGRRRDAARAEVIEARDALLGLTDSAQQAREEWLLLRQRRLDGMAAELASGLIPGDGCPVCGSSEHPRPATRPEGAVTRRQEVRAEQLASAAETARRDASTALAALEVKLAELRSAAGGDTDIASLQAEAEAAGLAADDVDRRAAGLSVAVEALAGFDRERESWLRDQVSLAQEARGAQQQVADHQARMSALLAVIGAARGEDPTLAARAARLGRVADHLDALASELREADRLSVAVTGALTRAEAGVRDCGLPSLATVAEAARDDTRIRKLDELRQRHDSGLAAVVAQLAEPELVDAGGRPSPDLTALGATA
ncbi:MAG: SMC family ATPase, partial [Sporichthyaceae bacterium]|nr:SMC family ATPase [Sporichthyaceae bacterium]